MHSYIFISYLLDYLTFTGCFFLNIISVIIITLFYYFILLNYVSVDSSFTDSIYFILLNYVSVDSSFTDSIYYFILLNYVSVDSSFTDSIYYFILLLCNFFLQVVFPKQYFYYLCIYAFS